MSQTSKESAPVAPPSPPETPRRASIKAHFPLDEEEEEEKKHAHRKKHPMLSFLGFEAKKYFEENIPIPMLNEFPGSCKWCTRYFPECNRSMEANKFPSFLDRFPLGAIAYLTLIGIFAFFMYSSYLDAISQAYISLENQGQGLCNEVPIKVSGEFLADTDGHWIDTSKFNYYDAAFSFDFASLRVTSQKEYTAMIMEFKESLKRVGSLGSLSNLAVNLIVWMTYIRFYSIENPTLSTFETIGYGQLQSVQLTGDPTVVFDAQFYRAAISDRRGLCNITSDVKYDQANAKLTLTYEAAGYNANPNCVGILPISTFGVGTLPWSLDTYTFELDVRTFAIAMAINLNFLDISTLQLANGATLPVNFQGVRYSMGNYFDSRYPLMPSLFCLKNITAVPVNTFGITQLCMIQMNSLAALPVFNHVGASDDVPEACDCTKPVGRSVQCNQQRLVSSLVVFNVDTSSGNQLYLIQQQVGAIFTLLGRYGGNYRRLNAAAFNATSSSVLSGAGVGSLPPNYRENAFQFCHLPTGQTCSVISWFAFSPNFPIVSENKFTLRNGSCMDTLRINDTVWDILANNPPVALVQDYFECYNSKEQAILNAAGIATGNASLFMLGLFFALVPVIYVMLAFLHRVPAKGEYSEKQKTNALDTFATVLLRVRDDRLSKEHAVIEQLFGELVEVMNEGDRDAEEIVEVIRGVMDPEEGDALASASEAKSGSSQLKSTYMAVNRSHSMAIMDRKASFGYTHIPKMSKKVPVVRRVGAGGRLMSASSSVFGTFDEYASPTKAKSLRPFTMGDAHNYSMIKIGGGSGDNGGGEGADIMRVMNVPNSYEPNFDRQSKPKLSIDDLVGRMTSLLSTAMLLHPPALVAISGPSIDDYDAGAKGTDLSKEYIEAFQLSLELSKYKFEDLYARDDRIIFARLANALCLHASLELSVELNQVASTALADSVSYRVGNRVLTYTALIGYSLGMPSSR